MATSTQPTPGEWAIMGGGLVALIGSFLDFVGDVSAWGRSAFPIVTLIPIYAVAAAVIVALTRFANVTLPDTVLGLKWDQITLALSFFATLMALCWLVASEELGSGAYVMLLGAAATLVGVILRQREHAAGTGSIG